MYTYVKNKVSFVLMKKTFMKINLLTLLLMLFIYANFCTK